MGCDISTPMNCTRMRMGNRIFDGGAEGAWLVGLFLDHGPEHKYVS
jgi:hypothetical protein